MELAAKAAALCVAGALLSMAVKQGSPPMALALTLGVTTAVLALLAGPVRELFALFRELGDRSGLSPELLVPLYKTLGIAVVVRTAGNLCRDAGESALGGAVETAGAVCTLLTALPLLRAVLSMLLELMA